MAPESRAPLLACHKLKYTIAAASEHSGSYVADNITRDEPTDQTSRWSGAYQAPTVKQWITLKLDSLAIVSSVYFSPLRSGLLLTTRVESITFGKVRSHQYVWFLPLTRVASSTEVRDVDKERIPGN